MLKFYAVLIPAICGIAGCTSAPDCAGQETKNDILDGAKKARVMSAYIFNRSTQYQQYTAKNTGNFQEYMALQNEMAAAKTDLQLDNIVTVAKSSVGSLTCKATLSKAVDGWGGATQEINYTVEKTSDGKSLVTPDFPEN